MKKKTFLIVGILIVLFSLVYIPVVLLYDTSDEPDLYLEEPIDYEFEDQYLLWQLGDVWYGASHDRPFSTMLLDMNNVPWDEAIVVGDFIGNNKYLRLLEQSNHKRSDFKHLAGNHEYSCDGSSDWVCLMAFRRNMEDLSMPNLFYSFDRGNIHVIVVSTDENTTDIKDSTFAWLEKEVANNQDKIIIIATHHMPHLFNENHDIDGLLKNYGIDLWLFGHAHCDHGDSECDDHDAKGDFYIEDETAFVTSGYSKNYESRYFVFEEDSDKVTIKSRKHNEGMFQDEFENIVNLRYTFEKN